MNNEKMRILEMIQEGRITAAEGMELMDALGGAAEETELRSSDAGGRNRFLRIRVNGDKAKKVNVNVPLNLIKAAGRFFGYGMAFIPKEAREAMEEQGVDLSKIDIQELIAQIDSGLISGRLVDIDAEDPDEGHVKVEIYID
jgi:hypothetical protein